MRFLSFQDKELDMSEVTIFKGVKWFLENPMYCVMYKIHDASLRFETSLQRKSYTTGDGRSMQRQSEDNTKK